MYLNLRIIFNTDEMNPLCGIHSNNSVCIYPLVEEYRMSTQHREGLLHSPHGAA